MQTPRSQLWGCLIAVIYLGLSITGFAVYREAYIQAVWQPRCWSHMTAIQSDARSTLEFVRFADAIRGQIPHCEFRDRQTQRPRVVQANDRDIGLVLGWGVWFVVCMIGGVGLAPKPKPGAR